MIEEVFLELRFTEQERSLVKHCRELAKGSSAVPVVHGPVVTLVAA